MTTSDHRPGVPRVRAGRVMLLGLVMTGCATTEVGVGPAPGPHEGVIVAEAGPPHENLGIPPGHLPPPGLCRIWFPGVPPGQQPPPGDCYELSRRVPPGAWLIERPVREKGHVYVNEYDPKRAGHRIEVRVYNASTGVFIRAHIP